jgi:ATP-dependent RNA helicase DDX18/HAS1
MLKVERQQESEIEEVQEEVAQTAHVVRERR